MSLLLRRWAAPGAALLVFMLATGCVNLRKSGVIAMQAGISTGFVNKIALVDGKPWPYVVYVPREYDPEKAWPCILFLHGAGERGKDGLVQTEVGLAAAIRRHRDWFPCIVVFPQCPDNKWWDEAQDVALQAFKQTVYEYNVDRSRLYLTGLSMGGFATWRYGASEPALFAALMPICGGGNPEDAAALAQTPIWAFHGAEDEVVPPGRSREMVEAVMAAGGDVRYTEFAETGHNSWDAAYGDRKHIRWLLNQSRPKAAD